MKYKHKLSWNFKACFSKSHKDKEGRQVYILRVWHKNSFRDWCAGWSQVVSELIHCVCAIEKAGYQHIYDGRGQYNSHSGGHASCLFVKNKKDSTTKEN